MKSDKIALVLEGGGSRGMFTAGILETFLEHQIEFKAVYGISAGALYGASYVSKQKGRNLRVNDFIGDKRYSGLKHLFESGSYFSWDFILDELAHNILPFDYATFRNSSDFIIGVSNCDTGQAEFYKINTLEQQEIVQLLRASSSLPLITPMVKYNGQEYLDGGLTDSIPFEQALDRGAEKVVVVLTRPRGYLKDDIKFKYIFKWFYRKKPLVYDMLVSRAQRYNESLKRLNTLEQEGSAFVIYPQQSLNIGRVERDPQKTARLYHHAMSYGESIITDLQKWATFD